MKLLQYAFNQPVGILSGYVVFIAVVVAGGWVAGLAHIEMSQPVALSLVSIGAVCGYFGGRHVSRSSTLSWFPEDCASSIAKVAGPFAWSGFVLSCILLVNAFVHHDPSWDGNVYHIPAIGLWHQAGRLHWINGDFGSLDLMNGYPKTGELLAWIFSVAFGSGWLNALNLFFMPLGFWGLLALCQLVGTSRSSALIASSLFLFVPVNICQSATTYLDSAYASSVAALLACMVFVLTRKPALLNDVVLGSAAGLAIGLKQPGLLLLVILGGLLFVATIYPTRLIVGRSWKSSLIVFGVAICVGGGWYLRNYYYGGSPLYPASVNVFGIELFPGQSVKDMIAQEISIPPVISQWPNFLRILYTWFQGISHYPHSILGVDARLGGLGLLWPLVAVPCIAYLLFSCRRIGADPRSIFLMILVIIAIAFVFQPNNWWARYTLWIYVAGIPAVALVLSKLSGRIFKFSALFIGVIAVMDCAPSLYYTLRFRGMLPSQELEGVQTSKNVALPFFPEMSHHMQELIAGGDQLILGPLSGDNSQLLGNLVLPLGFRKLAAIPSNARAEDLDALLRKNYRDIIWDKHWSLPSEIMDRFVISGDISRFYHLVAKEVR